MPELVEGNLPKDKFGTSTGSVTALPRSVDRCLLTVDL